METSTTIQTGQLVGNATRTVRDQRFQWIVLSPALARRQGYDIWGGQALIENCHTGYRLIVEIEGSRSRLNRSMGAPMMARLLAYEIETYVTEGVIRGRPIAPARAERMWTRVDNLVEVPFIAPTEAVAQ